MEASVAPVARDLLEMVSPAVVGYLLFHILFLPFIVFLFLLLFLFLFIFLTYQKVPVNFITTVERIYEGE